MKKWLNIKPKVYEFSEDEIDTETESEDDAYSLKDNTRHVGEDPAHGMRHCQTSGTPPVSYRLKHRRGKSETLRLQYINKKDVRLTIGTWNVAGRLPHELLQIDEWLCMKEPADIYILGFQEVVPLNAGNVLGAEDNRPIPKWEEIIRRTLNQSFESEETKCKSFSAPPSPVLRTSSAADALAAEIVYRPLDLLVDHSVNPKLNKFCGVDNADGTLDWPERSLDSTPQILCSNLKLRRVLSSSARIGFYSSETPSVLNPQKSSVNCDKLNRSYRSYGNLQSVWPEEHQEKSKVVDFSLSGVPDDTFCGEDDDLLTEEQYDSGTEENSTNSRPRYVRIVSKQMVGIYVSVWVRKRLRRHINNLRVSPVGVGLMGYMGNKGSVSVSMSLFQTRLCFVCSHLTSGHKDGDEQRRNSDVNEILRRTRFLSSVFDADQPQTIPSHDQIFWFGDLNYRVNMPDAEIRKLVARKQWEELINNDQLTKELKSGHVFDGWKEGIIDFPPTYKYEINSDRYVGENHKEGEKRRSPAWCDRILWIGKGIKQNCYKRAELRLSDHRPVSSTFMIEVEVFNHRKLQKALNFTNAAVHPEMYLDEEGELEF